MSKKDVAEEEIKKGKEEEGTENSDIEGDSDSKDEKVEENNEDVESIEAKYKRLAADFQNYKKRVEKEKADIYAYANGNFATDILEVVDNFERAIEQDKNDSANEKFLEGMELILKQLLNVLDKNGVKEIETVGVEFDPNYHHAVVMEKSDKTKSGHVSEVLQKGYQIKDKVIRPSMVKVAE